MNACLCTSFSPFFRTLSLKGTAIMKRTIYVIAKLKMNHTDTDPSRWLWWWVWFNSGMHFKSWLLSDYICMVQCKSFHWKWNVSGSSHFACCYENGLLIINRNRMDWLWQVSNRCFSLTKVSIIIVDCLTILVNTYFLRELLSGLWSQTYPSQQCLVSVTTFWWAGHMG